MLWRKFSDNRVRNPSLSKAVSEGIQVGPRVRWRKLLFLLVGGKRGTVVERDWADREGDIQRDNRRRIAWDA